MTASNAFDRVPFAPLRHALKRRGVTLDQVVELTGMNWSTIGLANRTGDVSVYIADRICVGALNVHPTAIYGTSWLNTSAYRAGRIDAAFDTLRQELAS